jgi:hypothetical protein
MSVPVIMPRIHVPVGDDPRHSLAMKVEASKGLASAVVCSDVSGAKRATMGRRDHPWVLDAEFQAATVSAQGPEHQCPEADAFCRYS